MADRDSGFDLSGQVALPADVSDEVQVQNLFAAAVARCGTIDILLNNAGVQDGAAFQGMTLAQWQRVLDVNLTGQFLCARAVLWLASDLSDYVVGATLYVDGGMALSPAFRGSG